MRLDPVRGLETEKRPDPCPAASPSLRVRAISCGVFRRTPWAKARNARGSIW